MTNLSLSSEVTFSPLSSRWCIYLVQLGIICYTIDVHLSWLEVLTHVLPMISPDSGSSPWIHQVTVLHISRPFHAPFLSSIHLLLYTPICKLVLRCCSNTFMDTWPWLIHWLNMHSSSHQWKYWEALHLSHPLQRILLRKFLDFISELLRMTFIV